MSDDFYEIAGTIAGLLSTILICGCLLSVMVKPPHWARSHHTASQPRQPPVQSPKLLRADILL